VPLKEQGIRITGGSNATRGQFPWQVALIVDNSWFCGGSLISNEWVLSAGHCYGTSYQIVLGATRYDGSETGAVTVSSTTSTQHPGYDESILNNDLLIIRLSPPVENTTYISPIRLRNVAGDLTGQVLRVSGWGLTSDSDTSVSPTLKYVDLTAISNTDCAAIYGSIITATKLCCGTSGGKSTCSGDSGGALALQESDGLSTQVGIVSFGASAGCELGYPVGFTRVTSYLDWISSITGISIG